MTGQERREYLRLALARLESGAFTQAAQAAEPVYLHAPDDLEALVLLGLAVGGCGHPDLAADLLNDAARRSPAAAHPAADLVRLLGAAGLSRAIESYFDAALALAPDDVRLLVAAASWQLDAGHNGRAEELLREAARLHPAMPGVQLGLATVEAERGSIATAIERLRVLIARGAGTPEALGNLATMLGVEGRFGEAWELFGRARSASPGNLQLAVNHGMALLKAGRLREGWSAFNRRLELPGHALLPAESLLLVEDPGTRLGGATVLVTHDSGFGDTLQFARYLPLLADRGARVLLWVPEPLRRLMGTVPGVEAVVSDHEAWPSFDWHCPVIRLAEVFGTTLDTVPAAVPYLAADPALAAQWAGRLPPREGGMRRVGLVWAGSARVSTPRLAAIDRRRSIDPVVLLPLLEVPRIEWVSLQMNRPPPPFTVIDPMGSVSDFADTAAIISLLDAVVSVDTSVAHLAGAMGIPVLLLDRYDNCWRWLARRADSPWYPPLRIFRQPAWGDWGAAVRAAADALPAMLRLPAPAPAAPYCA